MQQRFETRFGAVEWRADEGSLQLTFRRRMEQIPWPEITAAGVVYFSPADVPAGMPTDLLPGMGKLFDLNRRAACEQRQLVLTRGPSARRALRIPVQAGDDGAAALIEAVRAGAGARWIGEVSIEDHYDALGLVTPWWSYPLMAAGLALFGLVVLLAIAAFASLSGGEWSTVPPIAWMALIAWLLLAGGILFVYRRGR